MKPLHMNTIKSLAIMKKTFLLSSLLFTLAATAQNSNMFVVYSVKGTVSVIDNKVETKAKIGTILDGDETIKVGAGSFATIICNETRAFSLNKAGNYSTASLKDSCKISSGSVSSNYMKYVWTEMTKSKGTPEKNRRAYMANVGAVTRDVNNVWIDTRLDTINYVSGTIPLSWKAYDPDIQEFEFKLYDETATNTLFSKTVRKKHVDIADILKNIEVGKSYQWTAMVKGDPDNKVKKWLHYASKEDYNKFYNSIKNSETAETDAEKNFRIGFLLEEAHYLAEAYNHYLKATQLDATNGLYRYTFMSFKKDYEIK